MQNCPYCAMRQRKCHEICSIKGISKLFFRVKCLSLVQLPVAVHVYRATAVGPLFEAVAHRHFWWYFNSVAGNAGNAKTSDVRHPSDVHASFRGLVVWTPLSSNISKYNLFVFCNLTLTQYRLSWPNVGDAAFVYLLRKSLIKLPIKKEEVTIHNCLCRPAYAI